MADSIIMPAGGADPDREALTAAEGLTASLDGLTGELRYLRSYGKTSRRIIVGLVISICLDLLITAGFGYDTIRVNRAENASHASQISACQQANTNRAEDIAIWDSLLGDLAPASVRTPAVVKELAVLKQEVKVKDTPRNCQALYAK